MYRAISRAMAGLCLAAFVCSAQTIVREEKDTKRKYEVTCAGTASGTTPSCVVHVPSTVTGLPIRFDKIAIQTPTSANAVFEWGGATPAGGTTASVRGRNTTKATGATTLSGATSASPTSTKTFGLVVGQAIAFDASDDEFSGGAVTGRTLRVTLDANITGAYSIVITYYELL